MNILSIYPHPSFFLLKTSEKTTSPACRMKSFRSLIKEASESAKIEGG